MSIPKLTDFLPNIGIEIENELEIDMENTQIQTQSVGKEDNSIKTMTNKNIKSEDTIVVDKNKEEDNSIRYGVGLDVGTGFLVSASFGTSMTYKTIRNAFLEIDKKKFNPALFDKNKISYMDMNDKILVVGEDALEFAKVSNQAAQRPLSDGIINPKEKNSGPILKEMFDYIIKKSIKKDNEHLVFSIPGNQLNNPDFDTFYHSMSIESLCASFGVQASPINEGYAVAISELGVKESLTALSFSFGAGLVNTCLTYKGINIFEFSIDKSGDFIDIQSAKAVGESVSLISSIKEKELDLSMDEFSIPPEERALLYSYRFVIQNVLTTVKKAFSSKDVNVRILEPIPVIISGGTSKPAGFIDLFKKQLNTTKLPFEVSEVIHASDPLKSVARGCCLYAQMLEESENEDDNN